MMKGAGCWLMVQEVRAHEDPKFFFTSNLIFFVSINSVQNLQNGSTTPSGRKVCVVGGGG